MHTPHIFFKLSLAALLAGLLALPGPPQARAATIGVTTLADALPADGACSLREAVQAANADAPVDACPAGQGADTIVLPAGRFLLTLAGSGEAGDLDITSAITITGVDKNTTVIDGGALGDRILEVHPGARLVLASLALEHGGSAASGLSGGAIYSAGATTLSGIELAFNAAGGFGGAIVSASGALTLTTTIVRDNQAGAAGGIASLAGRLTISDSIINNNTANQGAGGGLYSLGELSVRSSWVHDNGAVADGGGIYSRATAIISNTILDSNLALGDGGNLYSGAADESATLALASSELRAGQARYGGGLFNQGRLDVGSVSLALNSATLGGAIYSAALTATVRLLNVTLAANTQQTPAAGAAITNAGAALQLGNTIVGVNGPGDSCAGPISSAGYNIDAGASCGLGAPGDLPSTDPLLGALPAAAQAPATFPLLAGSPALNAGSNLLCAPRDIAGRPRPHGLACDIGAYERNTGPAAIGESYTVAEDSVLTLAAPGLLANDADPETDSLQVARASWPTLGALVLGSNGAFQYTPPANFFGSDQFAYRVGDGALSSETVVVHLTITPVNDPPVAGRDSGPAIAGSAPRVIASASLLANDSDLEGDWLIMIAAGPRSSAGARAELAGDGVRYTPALGYRGPDSFSYRVGDGHGGSATGVVTVDVQTYWRFIPVATRH